MPEGDEDIDNDTAEADASVTEVAVPKGTNSWRESLYDGMEETDARSQRIFKLLFPLAIWLLSFVVAQMIINADAANRWFTLSFMYLVPPLGKESIIPMGMADGFAPYTMAFTVAFVDLWVAMFISWNYWYITKIPKVGPMLKKAEDKGEATMNKIPVMSKGAWWGIVLLSLIPAVGSGGFLGSIIGKLIGMKPGSVISAVFIGSLMSGLIYGYAAKAIYEAFRTYPWLMAGIFIFIILGVIGFYFYARSQKKKVEAAEKAGAA